MSTKLLFALIASTSVAHADNDVPGANFAAVDGQLGLSALTHIADGPDPLEQIVLVSARLSALVGDGRIGHQIGFDASAGFVLGRKGGAAYEFTALPAGLGMKLGEDAFVSLSTGVSVMGATGQLDDALLIPLELELEAGAMYHLIARARVSYALFATGRSVELDNLLAVRIPGEHRRRGFYIGIAHREIADTHFVGLAFGVASDTTARPLAD